MIATETWDGVRVFLISNFDDGAGRLFDDRYLDALTNSADDSELEADPRADGLVFWGP